MSVLHYMWIHGFLGWDRESENERTNQEKNARLPMQVLETSVQCSNQCKSNLSVLYLSNFSCVKPKSKKLITVLVDIKWIMVVVVFFNCQYYCFIIFYKDHSLVFIVNPHGARRSFRSEFIACSRTGPKISREQRTSIIKRSNTSKIRADKFDA